MDQAQQLLCRRVYKRYPISGPIHLATPDNKEANLSLKNLSGSGVCVCGNSSFKVNDLVNITLQNDSPFFDGLSNREARVAWSKQVAPDLWETGLDLELIG